ncbi:MAG: MGMT family protein [Candidatus Omnitrophica bacterium]|nr:MGMT family protein [Candidatus Omnitrophota bacterium]
MSEEVYKTIYSVIHQIPKGRVATYGQVAKLAGIPQQPRRVGYALRILPEGAEVPWHRVVNAQGKISMRWELGCVDLQRVLLEKEGIIFDNDGRIILNNFLWKADDFTR